MRARTFIIICIVIEVILVAFVLVAFSDRADAATRWNGNTVWVEEHVNGTYDSALRSSIKFVDQYTGSRMRIGPCPKGFNSRCVIVRYGRVTGTATGSFRADGWEGHITIERNIRGGYYHIRAVFDHELGHKFHARHNARCTSRMYQYRTCRSGHLSPRRFLASERTAMASQ